MINTFSWTYWIRQHVGEITDARRAWDEETRVISRRTTFTTGPRIKVKTEWTPRPFRRNTILNVGTLEELLQSTPSSVQEGDEDKYSQQPSVSSPCSVVVDANRFWVVL